MNGKPNEGLSFLGVAFAFVIAHFVPADAAQRHWVQGKQGIAMCSDGESVIAGGCECYEQTKQIFSSKPVDLAGKAGWKCDCAQFGGDSQTPRSVWALCEKP